MSTLLLYVAGRDAFSKNVDEFDWNIPNLDHVTLWPNLLKEKKVNLVVDDDLTVTMETRPTLSLVFDATWSDSMKICCSSASLLALYHTVRKFIAESVGVSL